MSARTHRRARIVASLATASVAAIALGVPAGAASASSHTAGAQRAVGLSGNGTALVSFRLDQPGSSRPMGRITGLVGDTSLIGIDFRVQNGMLHGVGNSGGIYTLSRTGAATKVSQLSVALSGMKFDVDFNPAANRLRVISDTGQNLRHNIDDGATAGTTVSDGSLAYPAVAPATTPTPGTGVTGAAYTNNDLSPTTATTLFDIDTMLDQVVVQSPANAGLLAATGKLGVDAGSDAGFDIYTDLRDGAAASATGFAVLSVGGKQRLYQVDLLTGRATGIGSFNRTVTDLAVQLDR